jgi:hypothetical protein
LALEFTVKRQPKQWNAKILSNNEIIADVKKREGPDFRLIRHKDNREWLLTNKIDNEHRRFSFSVRDMDNEKKDNGDDAVFTVRDHIFKHNGKYYMLACNPEGKLWQEYVDANIRYICRLDNFPFPDMAEGGAGSEYGGLQHHHLRQKQKRFRGVPVGETSGLAIEERGHRVKVEKELEDVGLFLAAISYLMHASA